MVITKKGHSVLLAKTTAYSQSANFSHAKLWQLVCRLRPYTGSMWEHYQPSATADYAQFSIMWSDGWNPHQAMTTSGWCKFRPSH